VENGQVVGDPASGDTRVKAGDPPKYAEGCHRVLAPGETWEGSLVVRINEGDTSAGVYDRRMVKMSVGDASAYDYASIARAGFYECFMNDEDIAIPVGKPASPVAVRKPPVIEVTRAPGQSVDRDRVTVSGVVTDDTGLSYVMVYDQRRATTGTGEVDEALEGNDALRTPDKVFFQGSHHGEAVRSVPFTADVQLEPGLNTVTIIATDQDGLHATRSVVTFYLAPELQAQLTDPEEADPVR
jgi:hypothetical protein